MCYNKSLEMLYTGSASDEKNSEYQYSKNIFHIQNMEVQSAVCMKCTVSCVHVH